MLEQQASTFVSDNKLTKIFKDTSDENAPQKKGKTRCNQAQFMTKELSKQIMGKSKSKNVYFKWPPRENFSTYKNEKKNKKTKKANKQMQQHDQISLKSVFEN